MTLDPIPVEPLTIGGVRVQFHAWLAAHTAELSEFRSPAADLDGQFASLRRLQRLLFDAGWIRLGWPAEVGGLGGPLVLRSVISEELAVAGYPPPFSFGTQETLGPAVLRFAPLELSTEVLPRLLSGDETWCQGFSEPDAGSDLASLRVRATDDGEMWRVSGEKIWTSWAQFADRCLLLVRTGDQASAHRGITALFVDMSSAGITVRPLVSMNGDEEFASIHFDGVAVPKSRTVGDVNGGWAVAMFILGCERGAAAWQRQAWMFARCADLLDAAPDLPDGIAGEIFELIYAQRLGSRRTVRALSAGEEVGALPSFDKLASSTAEKYLFDAALAALTEDIVAGTDALATMWRNDFLYSRAASIYGGTAEIQRNIVAERILGLPRD